MKSFLNKLLGSKGNGPEMVRLLLDELNVPVTASTLAREIEIHPAYNSLLSISDVLNQFGVNNLAARFDGNAMLKLAPPFIVQFRDMYNRQNYFTIVRRVEQDSVLYCDPVSHSWKYSSREDFLIQYKGIALLVEAEEKAGEKNYEINLKEEKKKEFLTLLTAAAIPLIVFIAAAMAGLKYGARMWPVILQSLWCLIGSFAGYLLIWYELDKDNPGLQQICSGSKSVNCGAILQSSAAKIGGISWSVIGFTYFTGGLLLLLFAGFNSPEAIFTIAALNLLALPYVFYSIYYQWRIARQWCVLCLSVQGLLILQFVTLAVSGWTALHLENFLNPEWVVMAAIAYGLSFLLTVTLLPVFRKAKESQRNYARLQRLKHNPQIFEALLAKQRPVAYPADGLGITLGKPDATYKIIKVCNPYCGPCAKAHVPLEELLHNNPDVQLQIIFTATNKQDDIANPPVKHLLAIAEKCSGNEEAIKKGLDDWYLATKKDYDNFSVLYPLNGELQRQEPKIEAMRQWCDATGITYTPTIFVNGYELPAIYAAEDLKYFLTV